MNYIFKLTRLFLILAFSLFIMVRKYKINRIRLLFILGISVLSLLNTVAFSGGISLILILLIVISSEKISLNKIFSTSIWTIALSHIAIIVCVFLNIIQDSVTTRTVGSSGLLSGIYLRHNMGFLIHNQIPLTFMLLYLSMIAWKKEKLKLSTNLVVVIANYFLFKMFGSRTVYLIIYMACLFYYIFKICFNTKFQIRKYLRMLLVWCVFPGCAFISYFFALTYNKNSKLYFVLDELLFHRISYSNMALQNSKISLLGHGKEAASATGSLGYVVDNGYISLGIRFGIIITIIILCIWSYMIYVSLKKQDYYFFLAILFFAIANLIDANLLSYKIIPFYCTAYACKKQWLYLIQKQHKKIYFLPKYKFVAQLRKTV